MLAKRLTAAALLVSVPAVALGAYAVQEGMEAMFPQPTEEHQELLKAVGTWKGTMTMHMPGMPTDPVEATETVEAIGKFWTLSHFECDFLGEPYHGSGVVGYDPQRGKYVGTWVDGVSSYLSVMEGEEDEDGKLVMRWEAPSMMAEGLVPHWFVLEHDGDSYTNTFYQGEGEGTKVMTIAMQRAKQRSAGSR